MGPAHIKSKCPQDGLDLREDATYMCSSGGVVASPGLAGKTMGRDGADFDRESRRRRVEKLRWHLRVARRAVVAKRATWASLGAKTPQTSLDRLVVGGFVAGGALGLVGIQVLSGLLFR